MEHTLTTRQIFNFRTQNFKEYILKGIPYIAAKCAIAITYEFQRSMKIKMLKMKFQLKLYGSTLSQNVEGFGIFKGVIVIIYLGQTIML